MNIRKELHIASLILFVAMLFSGGLIASAQSPLDDITFPIAELGNCENERECKSYCDEPAHIDECIAFAEKHNLIPEEEREIARKFEEAGKVGPGGCNSLQSCDLYCSDINNVDECLAFGEEHGLLEGADLEEARAVKRAIDNGAQLPGGCTSKESCEAYCSDEAHNEECFAFAVEAGFVDKDELPKIERALKIMAEGRAPGGCTNERECHQYCEAEANFEECLAFGEEAGFVSPEEAEFARKTGGEGPGGCKGDECRLYCEEEKHFEECLAFAEEHGLISEEDAVNARKTGGKGPGGCTGREACEAFCENPENRQQCFDFARENGFIPEEDIRQMEAGKRELERAITEAPDEVQKCIKEFPGIEEILAGDVLHGPEIGEHIHACFEEFMKHERFEDGDHPPFEGDFHPEDLKDLSPEEREEILREFEGRKADFEDHREFDRDGSFIRENPEDFIDRGEFTPEEIEKFKREVEGRHDEFISEEKFFEDHKKFDEEFDGRSSEDFFREEFEHRVEDIKKEEFERQFNEEFKRQHNEVFEGTTSGNFDPAGIPVEHFQKFEDGSVRTFAPESHPEDFRNFEEHKPPSPNSAGGFEQPPHQNFNGNVSPVGEEVHKTEINEAGIVEQSANAISGLLRFIFGR